MDSSSIPGSAVQPGEFLVYDKLFGENPVLKLKLELMLIYGSLTRPPESCSTSWLWRKFTNLVCLWSPIASGNLSSVDDVVVLWSSSQVRDVHREVEFWCDRLRQDHACGFGTRSLAHTTSSLPAVVYLQYSWLDFPESFASPRYLLRQRELWLAKSKILAILFHVNGVDGLDVLRFAMVYLAKHEVTTQDGLWPRIASAIPFVGDDVAVLRYLGSRFAHRQGEILKFAIDSCCLDPCDVACYGYLLLESLPYEVDVPMLMFLGGLLVIAPPSAGSFIGLFASADAAMVQRLSFFMFGESSVLDRQQLHGEETAFQPSIHQLLQEHFFSSRWLICDESHVFSRCFTRQGELWSSSTSRLAVYGRFGSVIEIPFGSLPRPPDLFTETTPLSFFCRFNVQDESPLHSLSS